MKKSFLKRAMAAAIAVPVALTQTLLCASFAADTTEETATDTELLGTLSVGTFVGVEANPESNVPSLVSEEGTTRTYEQVSVWNQAVYGILNSIPSGTVEALDVAALAETITSDAWYAEALKNAMSGEGASAAVQVNADSVVITIGANYAYAADVQAFLNGKLGDVAVDLGNPTADVDIVLTVDTADLSSSKTVEASAVVTVDGITMNAAYLVAYANTKLAEIRTAAVEAVKDDAALTAEVNALFDGYQAKLDKATAELAESRSESVEAADYDTVLALVKDKYAGNAAVDKLPDTIGGVLENETAVNMFVAAVNQLDVIVANYGYDIELTAQDLVDLATGMYTVTVDASAADGVVNGATTGYAEDDITIDAYEALVTYFTDLEAANGYELVEGSLKTEKFIEVSGTADIGTFSGEVTLDVTRMITYEIVDPEDTTTTTSDSDTSDDGTTTTASNEGSDDGSSTTASNEGSDDGSSTTASNEGSDDGSSTTASNEGSDDGSSTTASNEGSDDGSSTTASNEGSDDGSSTTTVDSGVVDPGSSDSSETTTESGESTTTTESEPTVVVEKAVSAVAKTDNFYFSHDDSELTAEMLLESAQLVVTTDGVAADPVDVLANIQLGTTKDAPSAVTPADLHAQAGAAYAALPVYAFYVDPDDAEAAPVLLETEINVYVGVKGDVTLTGEADAIDAAAVLVFAASVGAGNADAKIYSADDATLENFAFFLGDTETEDKTHVNDNLNAMDAAAILRFAAMEGALTEDPTIAQIKEFWEIILATATV